MSECPLGFGLIGCGGVAPHHAEAMKQAVNAQLVTVADLDPQRAARFAERYGVRAARDVAELLADSEVEAVSLAVPPLSLVSLGLQAAAAGKHVLAEKPLATSPAEAGRLIVACERAGVRLSVWFERRYQPFVTEAKRLVNEGALGTLHLALIHCLTYKPPSYWQKGLSEEPSAWRRSLAEGGGVLNVNACHQLDLVRHITGLEVEEAFARKATVAEPIEVENLALVSLRCRGGALLNLVASSCTHGLGRYPAYTLPDVLSGTEGSLLLGTRLELSRISEPVQRWEHPLLDLAQTKARAVDDFARAVRAGEPPPIAAHDAVAVLEVLAAAHRSAADGRPVLVKETQT